MGSVWIGRTLAVALGIALVAAPASTFAQAGVDRRIVHRQDVAIPGYEVLLMEVTIAVGGREARHSHPGELIGRLLEGELTLEQEGLPTKVFRPGDSTVISAGRVHAGINNGRVPLRLFATLLVPKDKPATTEAASQGGAR